MRILWNQMSQTPIYEQIKEQIRKQILSKSIAQGEMLPSIRVLAKDLGVGIITVKRAYDDLCAEGILISLQGRGVFVAEIDIDKIKEIQRIKLREMLEDLKHYCELSNITEQELVEEIHNIYGGDHGKFTGN